MRIIKTLKDFDLLKESSAAKEDILLEIDK
jgi:hypothetical protein